MSTKASQNHWDLIASLPMDGNYISFSGSKKGGNTADPAELQSSSQPAGRSKRGGKGRGSKQAKKTPAPMPQSYLHQIEQDEKGRKAPADEAGPLRSPSLSTLRPPSPTSGSPTAGSNEQERDIWIPAALMDYLDDEWKPASKKKHHAKHDPSGRAATAPIPIVVPSLKDESPKRLAAVNSLPPPSPDSRSLLLSLSNESPSSAQLLPPPTPPAARTASPRWTSDELLSPGADPRSRSPSPSFDIARATATTTMPPPLYKAAATGSTMLASLLPATQPLDAADGQPPAARKHPQQPQPPPVSSVDVPADLFCESCQRTFAKATVFVGHLAGRPHRVAERKRLERLQASEAAAKQPPAPSAAVATKGQPNAAKTPAGRPSAPTAAAKPKSEPPKSAVQKPAAATTTAPLPTTTTTAASRGGKSAGQAPAASSVPLGLSPPGAPSGLSPLPSPTSSLLQSSPPSPSPLPSPVSTAATATTTAAAAGTPAPRKYQQPQPPPASSVHIPDDLFCESCQRTFAKQTVYLGHLAGRPHRVAERKRLERLEAAAAGTTVDGKAAKPAAGQNQRGATGQPGSPKGSARATTTATATTTTTTTTKNEVGGDSADGQSQSARGSQSRSRRGSAKQAAAVGSGDAAATTAVKEAPARTVDGGATAAPDSDGKPASDNDVWPATGLASGAATSAPTPTSGSAVQPAVFSPFGMSYPFFSPSFLPDFSLPAFPLPAASPLSYPSVAEPLPELDFPLPRASEPRSGPADSTFSGYSAPLSPGPQRSRFGFALQDDLLAPAAPAAPAWPVDPPAVQSPAFPLPPVRHDAPDAATGLDQAATPAKVGAIGPSKARGVARPPPGFSPDAKNPPPGFTPPSSSQKTYVIPARR